MDKILELADQRTAAAAATQEMDDNLIAEFLTKNSVWDFHNMTRDEYNDKTTSEKQLLMFSYYNEMLKGKNFCWYFFISSFF